MSIANRKINSTQFQAIMTTGTEYIHNLKSGSDRMSHPNVCRLPTSNVSIANRKTCRLPTFDKNLIDNNKLNHIACLVVGYGWVNLPRCHKVVIRRMPESVSIDNHSVSIDNQNVSIDNQKQQIKPFKQLVTPLPVFFYLFYLFHLFQGGLSA